MLRARAAREENELTCRKLESNVSRELSRIANDIQAIAAREKSLASASAAAEESARTVRENVATGLISPLEYPRESNRFSEDQERTARRYLSAQRRSCRMGPRNRPVFSIFGRNSQTGFGSG